MEYLLLWGEITGVSLVIYLIGVALARAGAVVIFANEKDAGAAGAAAVALGLLIPASLFVSLWSNLSQYLVLAPLAAGLVLAIALLLVIHRAGIGKCDRYAEIKRGVYPLAVQEPPLFGVRPHR